MRELTLERRDVCKKITRKNLTRLTNAIWQKEPTRRMVRTFSSNAGLDNKFDYDGTVRAFVSDKFKTFDNVNLLQTTLPQLNGK